MTDTASPTPAGRQKFDLKHPLARFLVVGVANTVIDMGVLVLLTRQGMGLFGANLISTTCGLVFSFLVNRKFTFHADGTKPVWLQATQFTAVTLFGLWVLQPPIITGVQDLVAPMDLQDDVALLVGKAAATAVTIVWNYVLYSRFVFRKSRTDR